MRDYVLLLTLFLPASLGAQPVFPAAVEVVYVDVFVVRDGQPVSGLTGTDFEVLDNGVRQTVELATLESIPTVAVMVFDVSGSVRGAKLEDLRAAGRALLAGLREQDQAALVAFSQELRVVVPQAGGNDAVRRGLDGLEPGGGTAVWDALYAGLKLSVSQGRAMVVLFTDGQDNLSWLSDEQVLRVAEESTALVHVVAIAPPPAEDPALGRDLRDLDQLAKATGGQLWHAGASAQLARTFLRILAEMQSRYLLSYTPAGVAREGWHRIEVKLRRAKGSVRSRTRYFVQPGTCSTCPEGMEATRPRVRPPASPE